MPNIKNPEDKNFSDNNRLSVKNVTIVVALIGLAGIILNGIIGKISCDNSAPPPEFRLVKGMCYHPDSSIIIQAANDPAQRNKPIIFEIDEFPVYQASPVKEADGEYYWTINLKKLNLHETVTSDGVHYVCFGFTREKMSLKQPVFFDTRNPQAIVTYRSESPGDKKISGRIVDDSPMDSQNIQVEIALRHQEDMQTIHLPVNTYSDDKGNTMYEFEYLVQNIPQINKDDPRYSQPFFALIVKDEAGNEFLQSSTYNAFMAEGVQQFGNRSTQVVMQKIEGEETPKLSLKVKSNRKANIPGSAGGPPLITLRVLIRSSKYVRLSWNRLPENLRAQKEEYVMLRQKHALGVSLDTTFTDRSIDPDSGYQYQLLARGKGGKYYASNTVELHGNKLPKTPFRSMAATLSIDEVKTMLIEKNLFDSEWNKNTNGNKHSYELRTIKGDSMVADHATGLWWQQGGSSNWMKYDAAKACIKELNRNGYGGYDNWRLPTLEEAMSLMEPGEKNGLYIHPMFDRTQKWIWTADMVKGERRAWVVYFYGGKCYYYLDSIGYVRAVRSGQSSVE